VSIKIIINKQYRQRGDFTAGSGQSFVKKDSTDTLTAATAVLMVGVAHYT
jgi:hypothetical protein